MQRYGLKLLALLFVVFASANVYASEVQYDVGGGYAYFSGDPNKSLAPNTGYLVRFGAEAGRKTILKWTSNLTLAYSSSTSTFIDAGSFPSLSYTLVEGEFNLGFKLEFLAAYDKLPVQPYVGATGSIGSTSFKFAQDAAVSATFPKTDAENFYGYAIFVGVDISFTNYWGMGIEVEQSATTGTVAKQPFSLNSNRVFLNLFFQP